MREAIDGTRNTAAAKPESTAAAAAFPTIRPEFFVPFFVLIMNYEHKD
jgi:hypothetical protein